MVKDAKNAKGDEDLTMNPAMETAVNQFKSQFFFDADEILTLSCSEVIRLKKLFDYSGTE